MQPRSPLRQAGLRRVCLTLNKRQQITEFDIGEYCCHATNLQMKEHTALSPTLIVPSESRLRQCKTIFPL